MFVCNYITHNYNILCLVTACLYNPTRRLRRDFRGKDRGLARPSSVEMILIEATSFKLSPLVNIQKMMENHNFQWVNPL